ncbi:hypothetical protein SCB71_13125 [Herbiconiux sp. KACC 21604]|uniref:hypothetical protein n=1 Tax=unclassified Herbiconiux TaxID=2618217 RepID=UPI001C1085EC|nr:hypothetical protein [Herbiconiux sp. SALV-R1]WPO85154.1 hypothetical protein SCB71_13125 [Herbiconiux sp. KACC 21604]
MLPQSPSCVAALEVARNYHSDAMLNHGIRSYLWAVELARKEGLVVDDELLFVSAVLHDIGLSPAFDNRDLSFEYAGGEVAWVFGAGAGWAPVRRRRAAEIVVRHMADEVSPHDDPEGYLLCEATGLDISGRGAERWSPEYRTAVVAAFPRLDLAAEFLSCFEAQAAAKPASSPATALTSGLAARLATNPLDAVSRDAGSRDAHPGHADPGPRDAGRAHPDHTDAGHTAAGHADPDHTDAGHTAAGHADPDHTDAGHTAARHADPDHTNAGHTAARHADPDHTDAGQTAAGTR